MNLAIVLALGAMTTVAISDLIYRVVQRKGITASTFLVYQFMTFSAAVWAFWGLRVLLGRPESVVAGTWQFGLPAGIVAFGAMILFLESLKTGQASVNAPIFRLNFVVTAVAAIVFLNEALTVGKVIGVLLAVISVLSLANLGALRTGGSKSRRAFALVLLGAFLFGLAGVLSKHAINLGTSSIALTSIQTIGFGSGAVLYALVQRALRPNGVTLRFAPLVGLLQLAFILLLFESLQRGDASVAYPIAQLSFVVTAVLAILLLKEAATVSKFAGLGLAMAAVVAFTL